MVSTSPATQPTHTLRPVSKHDRADKIKFISQSLRGVLVSMPIRTRASNPIVIPQVTREIENVYREATESIHNKANTADRIVS